MEWDFGGYASRNNVVCNDGKIIRPGAFDEQDGQEVTLVFMHDHKNLDNIIGRAKIECRPDGTYCYGKFNDSPKGQLAKRDVMDGSLNALSIWANDLVFGPVKDIVKGTIREISLVISGANPGAFIETTAIAHSGDGTETDAEIIFYPGEYIQTGVQYDEPNIAHSSETNKKDNEKENRDMANKETIKDVWDSMTELQQQIAVYLAEKMVEARLEEIENEKENAVAHSAFENGYAAGYTHQAFLNKEDVRAIMKKASRIGSLKDATVEYANDNFIQHDGFGEAQPYGIENVDYLFPDAVNAADEPYLIHEDDAWVEYVFEGARHIPTPRFKTVAADITTEEARARGYIKGNKKIDEVFGLLKRETTPTTVYKKQSFDNDDYIDIESFDVFAWIKRELQYQLKIEIARTAMIGDGRSTASPDKINETHIRPIFNDDDLFTIKAHMESTPDGDGQVLAKEFMNTIRMNRKHWKGTGTPTLFTTEDMLENMLSINDGVGRPLYADVEAIARTLRVKRIVTIPQMDGLVRTDARLGKNFDVYGVMVNMSDYTFGANKGGKTSMFQDFNMDYNKHQFLVESRLSGALTKPYSAMTIEADHVGD